MISRTSSMLDHLSLWHLSKHVLEAFLDTCLNAHLKHDGTECLKDLDTCQPPLNLRATPQPVFPGPLKHVKYSNGVGHREVTRVKFRRLQLQAKRTQSSQESFREPPRARWRLEARSLRVLLSPPRNIQQFLESRTAAQPPEPQGPKTFQ